MSFCLSLIFVGLLALVRVDAHGHLSVPLNRESSLMQHEQNAPVAFPLADDFICKNRAEQPSSQWTTLTAGQSTTVTWAFEAAHPGDCFAYLSYDASLPDAQKKWFKVGQWKDCNMVNLQAQSFKVPDYLPACEHCVLRWEWYALHLQSVGVVEYYSQCADVKIAGKSAGVLPTPQFTIPGHLPMDAKFYRDPYSGVSGPLVGPPLATVGGSAYSCTSSYDKSCVTAPVSNNPCTVSHQKCVTSNTFQACQIGRGITEWGPSMSCQTGLVCADAGDGAHIYCVRPSSAPTPPVYTPPVVVTPPPVVVVTPPAPTPAPVPTPPVVIRPSTTAAVARPPVVQPPVVQPPVATPPVVVVQPSPPSGSSQPCTLRDQVCVGSSQYQTCTNGREANYWAPPQKCATGLSCHPSATGNNIYCY